MGKTNIPWCDVVWNPVVGCSKVSAGCQNCYAEKMAWRLRNMAFAPGASESLTKYIDVVDSGQWNGQIRTDSAKLAEPLRWKKPRRVFVNSMGDLFHEEVPDEFIDRVFAVMADASQHVFMVLTKRPRRMLEYLSPNNRRYTARKVFDLTVSDVGKFDCDLHWPLDNVWLGVTVENQIQADMRILTLLLTPAKMRFVSIEPMLADVDLTRIRLNDVNRYNSLTGEVLKPGSITKSDSFSKLDMVICGGESGPGARPMHPDWPRSLRDQCQSARVPFFFKSWGEWTEDIETPICQICGCTEEDGCANGCSWVEDPENMSDLCSNCIGEPAPEERPIIYLRVGKKTAGRSLDGRTWEEYPNA